MPHTFVLMMILAIIATAMYGYSWNRYRGAVDDDIANNSYILAVVFQLSSLCLSGWLLYANARERHT